MIVRSALSHSGLLLMFAAAGSSGLLLGAFSFEYFGGMAPCALCVWQRWAHVAAILVGVICLRLRSFWLAALGAVSAGSSAVLGIYHTGVEQGLWEGLATCSAGVGLEGLTAEEALQAIMSATAARCDEVPWQMAGLSMATWNAVFSTVLAALWMLAAYQLRKKSFGRKISA